MRRIVVGEERQRLDTLEAQQPFVSAERVGAVLPEAAAAASRSRRSELAVALEPTLTTAMRELFERDSEVFAQILSPTIGAAVARAVREAFAALVQRIDETLSRSLSVQSVGWRVEAWRTGRPFAEIVLARTLVFRVEQAFLIHSSSGVALRHVVAPGVGALDPDQVASMLAAIDAFVVEAFAAGEPAAHVARFEAGGVTVWIDRDRLATVAAVVRGTARRELADTLREARERIAITLRPELEGFATDVAPFASSQPFLEDCLLVQRAPPSKAPRRWLLGALALIALVLSVALGVHVTRRVSEARTLERATAALRSEPGIVVLFAEDGRIAGLHDPLAPAPEEVLERRGLTVRDLAFAPFDSHDPRLAEARVRAALRPPDGVEVALADGTLRLAGEAPRAWIDRARVASTLLAEVDRLDAADLRAREEHAALRDAITALEATEIRFAAGSPALVGAAVEAVDRAAPLASDVLARAREARAPVCIVVRGHAEDRGAGRAAPLRAARASAVLDALRERGIPGSALAASAEGTGQRATFRVWTSTWTSTQQGAQGGAPPCEEPSP